MRVVLAVVLVGLMAGFLWAAPDIPLGQSTPGADSLFETQRGYFHPALSISEVYTDNLFNTETSEENEYITTITPALWLAFPGQLEPAQPLTTVPTSTGGLLLTRFAENDSRPFHAFLKYEAGIKRHKNFDRENITTHNLRALMRATLTSGFSLEVNDVYVRSHDAYATGISIDQSKFNTNMVSLRADMPVGERFKVQLQYSNFLVDYDSSVNSFRDRTDNKLVGSLYYALSQKTRIFAQAGVIDVAYDEGVNSDNTQQIYSLGFDYALTDKVQALAKVGYNYKDNDEGKKLSNLIYELQADYQFTPKNNLNLQLWRAVKETDTPGTSGINGTAVNAAFSQNLAERLTATLTAGWARDDYNGSDRQDNYIIGGASIGYSLKKWFEISGGYNFTERDSNQIGTDYSSNELFINLTGKI